ncbi:inactive protein RESTRICTED TEV MOVEMENT 2-like [Vicia villosa]|uniref:inactive protein RESTRICTED TEV MOVEMENT 2-like n=1 Tax=Vicia villosa TaxID=3911 RepID=UPI00273B3E95|nr:inactive protein RESTRICTED TEV MOVEMENT 2-like [Vicia villosa]
MAMRSRTPIPRAKPSTNPVYETFKPMSELKENEQEYFLHIYLPGFIKERISIKYVALSRTLWIIGQRQIVGSNKWSQFDQSYPVPENCEVEKLEGKFENGTLIVAMPKKFPSLKSPQVETPKEKFVASPRTPKGTNIPSKNATNRVMEESTRDKKVPSSPSNLSKGLNDLSKLKEQKGVQQESFTTQSPKGKLKALEPYNVESSRPKVLDEENNVLLKVKTNAIGAKGQKGQEEVESISKFKMDSTKQVDDEKIKEEIRKRDILEQVKKQLREEEGKNEKKNVANKEIEDDDKKTYESSKMDQRYVDHNTFLEGKEIRPRKESPKEEESFDPKDAKKESVTNSFDKAKMDKEDYEINAKENGIFKEVTNSASQVVKKIGEGKLDEKEKPLVVNMGAAILVIVALGSYVTYKFGSSSKN